MAIFAPRIFNLLIGRQRGDDHHLKVNFWVLRHSTETQIIMLTVGDASMVFSWQGVIILKTSCGMKRTPDIYRSFMYFYRKSPHRIWFSTFELRILLQSGRPRHFQHHRLQAGRPPESALGRGGRPQRETS